jgi:N-acetylglucosamine-6-sulfatase
MKNSFFLIPVLIANIFISKGSEAFENNRNEKPNFVFILVDDLAFDAIQSSNRYPFLKTPNIQRLQDEGVTFSNFFCTTSLCSPSRASFLTGVYAHTHGVNQNNDKVDPDWNIFKPYPLLLQEQGYETAFIGKTHMAHLHGEKQIRPGFDYWLSFRGQGVYFDPELNENGREFKTTGYITDILTKYAKDWLTREQLQDKPFSICVWHKAIHGPFSPAPRDINLYKGEKLPEPPYNTYTENFKGKPQWQKVRSNNKLDYDTKIDTLPRKTWDPLNKKYFSMLKTLNAVDESVGVIYKTLEDMGELDNTVIIFSSDNGYFMGEHTFHDKRLAYESSMRIPMIIRYPGAVKAGTHIEQMCLNIDLAPTILDMAKVNIPTYIQGKSFLPLLKNEKQLWRDSFLYEYYVDDKFPKAGPDLIAFRTEKYKLVKNFLKNDIDELYNLENDPGEMNNLIKNADYENIKEQLREKAGALMEGLKYNRDRDWWLRTIKNE